MKKKKIVVTQGFIGANIEMLYTTLGREGSDYTAAILAYCLEAPELTIWKDVKGVYTADPKKFESAQLVEKLSYKEAIELTFYGAQIIHPKTIKPIQNSNCILNVRSFIDQDCKGTQIGNFVNIQDNATIHATYQKASTTIGNYVSIGHNAIVHGCAIHDNVLIGMGAIVMDHCIVESYSIVAAGAVVPANTHIKEGELWAGIPAKKIKEVSKELKEGEIERIANNYKIYSSWFENEQ
jgi:aspartate kinase